MLWLLCKTVTMRAHRMAGRVQGVSMRGTKISCPRCEPDPSLFGSPVQSRDAEWERLSNGIPGQVFEMHGLWNGFCVHSRRTTVLPRQEVHQRTQTLQELQGQAGSGARNCFARSLLARFRIAWIFAGILELENRDSDQLFPMRERDHRAVPADPRAAGAVPRVLSAGAATGGKCLIGSEV